MTNVDAKTLYIEPGIPWENGYCESFNSKLWASCSMTETVCRLKEAKVFIAQWRHHYNITRRHSSLGVCFSAIPPCPPMRNLP